MKIRDLNNVIDKDIPIWLNENGYSDRYENYSEFRNNSDVHGNDAIRYITVDSNGEFTIEI